MSNTLLAWASPWDDGSTPSPSNAQINGRKRVSTMKKSYNENKNNNNNNHMNSSLIAGASPYPETNPEFERMDEESEEDKNLQNTIKKSQNVNEQRNNNINRILEKMTNLQINNDGSGLGDFNPPPRPSVNNPDKDLHPSDLLPKTKNPNTTTFGGSLSNGGTGNRNNSSNYHPVEMSSADVRDYNKMYSVSPQNTAMYKPYYSRNGDYGTNGNGGSLYTDDQLMKKINYMIHLLEEQRKEKTDNVMEEFVLYSFLGIFIIYIVDSFTRSGKYTR